MVHTSNGNNFYTKYDKTIKFSELSFLGGYTNLKIFQQNPGGEVGRFHVVWMISNGMT